MLDSNPNLIQIGNSWDQVFSDSKYFSNLNDLFFKLMDAYALYPEQINPSKENIFHAFKATPIEKIHVVLLGQDPYPGHGVADGLAFSTSENNPTPASLLNINKELNMEFQRKIPIRNNLSYLAEQGVFLFNTCLISKDGQPFFFGKEKIFSDFSKSVISCISKECGHVVFLLLGSKAQFFSQFVDVSKHVILSAPHPSPLSANRGFFGSNVFKKTNEILSSFHENEIEW